tara:strand:+ start:268 stop:588 length:321 start_codon:yes stop_codon:yes gene_type:complete
MAIRQNKEEIVLEFIDNIYNEVRAKFSEDAGIKNVLYHLIESGLVDPKQLRDYMVISDYKKIIEKNAGHKTYTFMDLSIKYDISDRTAQTIVYRGKDKFKGDNNIR